MGDREEQMKSAMRELAYAYIVQYLLAQHLRAAPDPDGAAAALTVRFEEAAERLTFPGLDPALSDVSAQEFRDVLVRIVDRALSQARSLPADPEDRS